MFAPLQIDVQGIRTSSCYTWHEHLPQLNMLAHQSLGMDIHQPICHHVMGT